MKRISISFFLLICFILLIASAQGLFAQIFVDDDFTLATPGWGVTHFATITNGVAAALPFGTVDVYPGNYDEAVTISSPLTLSGGFGGGTSTWTKTPATNLLTVTSDNVTITNFTFTGNMGSSAFIYMDGDNPHSNITISNNTFSNAITTWHIIRAGGNKTNLTITGNTFTNSTCGTDNAFIYLYQAGSSIAISNNSFTNIPDTYSLYVIQHNASGGARTVDLTITTNAVNFTGHNRSSAAIDVRYANRVLINNNNLTGTATDVIYQVGVTAASVIASGGSSTINSNTITGFSQNIRVLRWTLADGFSDGLTITNNTSTNAVYYTGYTSTGSGLYLAGTNLTVTNNEFTSNANQGIYVPATVPDGATNDITGTVVNYNKISGNTNYGIRSLLATATLNAEKNWWGHATGPSHSSNPHGTGQGGDASTDYVDFTPWYATSTTTSGTEYVSVTHAATLIAYSNTVQGAVNGSLSGSSISVSSAGSPYGEDVTVNKSNVTITGVGSPTVNKFILAATPIGAISGFSAPSTATVDVINGGTVPEGFSLVNAGGTLNVSGNHSTENVTINKNITIVGSGGPTVLSFTLTAGAVLGGGSGGITAPTVNINQSGGTGTKLDDAVLLTSSGGTINVYDADVTQYAAVTINKSLLMQSKEANVTITGASPAITVSADEVIIVGFNFVGYAGSYAVDVTNGAYDVDIHFCNMLAPAIAPLGIRNQGSGAVNAANNWWGHASGPTHSTNPPGSGATANNSGSGSLTLSPWITAQADASVLTQIPGAVTNQTNDNTSLTDTKTIITTTGATDLYVMQFDGSPYSGLIQVSGWTDSYFDVFVSPSSNVSELKVRFYYPASVSFLSGTSPAKWYNGYNWQNCSSQQVVTPSDVGGYGGYIEVTITNTTRPKLIDLNATSFGFGSTPNLKSVIVNEWSQGASANKEWVELLVTGTTTDTAVDLRGSYLTGILTTAANKKITFANHSLWQQVTRGSLIVIYNGNNPDASLPSDDLTFGSDNRVVIPHNNATYFTVSGAGTQWDNATDQLFSNSNSSDGPIIYDATNNVVFSWQGSYAPGSSLYPGSGQLVYYESHYNEGDFSDDDDWALTLSTSGYPGRDNGGDNLTMINAMLNNRPSITLIAPNSPAPGATWAGGNGRFLTFVIKLGSEVPAYNVVGVSFKFRRGWADYFLARNVATPYIADSNLFQVGISLNGTANIDTTVETGIINYATIRTTSSIEYNGSGGIVTRLVLTVQNTAIPNGAIINFFLTDVYAMLIDGRLVPLTQFIQQRNIMFITSVSGGVLVYKVGKGDSQHDGDVDANDVTQLATKFGLQGGTYSGTWNSCTTVVRDPWGVDAGATTNLAMWSDHDGNGRVDNQDVLWIGLCFGSTYSYTKSSPRPIAQSNSTLQLRIFDESGNAVKNLIPGKNYQFVYSLDKVESFLGSSFYFDWEENLEVNSYQVSDAMKKNTTDFVEFVRLNGESRSGVVAISRVWYDGMIGGNNIDLIRFNVKVKGQENLAMNVYDANIMNIDGENFALKINQTPLSAIPAKYALYQNYPNPFNPVTKIKFDLPEEAKVTLKIYNTLGEEVMTLISSERLDAGSYERTFNATPLTSGVYIYRLSTDKFTSIKKMLMLK